MGLNYLLKHLKINKNAYYNYVKNITINRLKVVAKNKILNKIVQIYHKHHGVHGYRMMRDELVKHGVKLSYKTIYRYMRELKLKSITRSKYKYIKGDAHKVFANLLLGDFKASKPNEKWCIDFTYLTTKNDKKVYNCSILDLFDRSIVGTFTDVVMDSDMAINTVKRALNGVKTNEKIMLHSDQGSQFTSKKFIEFCNQNSILQSMSRAGKPTDNAPMERFFSTLKCEFYNLFNFIDMKTLRKCLNNYILVRYNYSRPHNYNLGASPAQMRSQYLSKKKSA